MGKETALLQLNYASSFSHERIPPSALAEFNQSKRLSGYSPSPAGQCAQKLIGGNIQTYLNENYEADEVTNFFCIWENIFLKIKKTNVTEILIVLRKTSNCIH